MNTNENQCPFCGAPLQQNASFCLHCMKSLDTKTEIKKKKSAPKRLIAICAAVLLVCAAAVSAVLIIKNNKTATPVCTSDVFIETAQAASEKLGCDELWQPGELVQTHYDKKENDAVYHTKSGISDAGVSVIFRNGGEAVDIALCDIKESDLESAYLISESAVSGALGHYIDKLAAFLRDRNAYPCLAYEEPFEKYFTDALKRTEKYSALAEENNISTEYSQADIDSGKTLIMLITAHNENGEALYDLYFEIQ